MRSFDPDDEYDRKTLKSMAAEPWMIAHLKLNPDYCSWGPGEDYMSTKGDGWGTSQELASWSAFGPWKLDELNECVHFYFELDRASKQCPNCENGYNPQQAQRFHDEWYGKAEPPFDPVAYGATPIAINNPKLREVAERNVARAPDYYGHGDRALQREITRLHAFFLSQWAHHLVQADVDALVAAGRLRSLTRDGHKPTAEEVNTWSLDGMGHDSINQHVCTRARCERAGVPMECMVCNGSGHVFTEPAGHLNLVVWMIHPRKGCSRGVRILNLSREDALAAREWLRTAAERNAERFAKVIQL